MKKAQLLILLIFLINPVIFSQITITGTVTSADDGMGLPGTAVFVKGTTNGTTTDIDGKYKLTVPQTGVTIVYSFVGLKSQEIVLASQSVIDIVLKSDVFKMEEVIVAGVASGTPKRKLSVSVAKVDSKELEDVPASSAATALQGKVAGVVIVSGNGNPGQSADIRLRGTNSLFEGQAPLIIVDGVAFEGEMADLNGNDVESYEVVKGASASALYGSKAGSGVIVIHTKRGNMNEERTEVKIRNEVGQEGLLKEISMASHNPYVLASDYNQPFYTKYAGVTYPSNYQGGSNGEVIGSRTLKYDHYADNPFSFTNDLQKQLFKTGLYYTNNISVSSSGKKTAYFASFENNNNSGIIYNISGSSRQNFKINADHKITDNLKISSSTLFSQNTIDMPSSSADESQTHVSGGQGSPFYNLLLLSPDVNLNVKSPDSMILKKYYNKPDQWSNAENPKHSLYYENRRQNRNDLLQNFSANYSPLKWINFDADYSFEKQNTNFTKNDPIGFQTNGQQSTGFEYKETTDYSSQIIQLTTNLQGKFGDFTTKGKVSYMFEQYVSDYFYASGSGKMAADITSMGNLSNKSSFTINSLNATILAEDYFGIFDMDYKDKYIASVLYRVDGSSLFGPQNRWNPYYRVSLAYRLNEDFHIPGFQELKIRAAIGTSGQRPGFYYQYETYPINPNKAIVLGAGTSPNPKIKPANTKETELAINAEFLEMFEFELVRSWATTDGLFFKKPQPAVTGFSSYWANAASSTGNTWEATLGAQIIKKNGWDWNVNFTYDRVRQKLTNFDGQLLVGPDVNGTQIILISQNSVLGEVKGYDWVKNLDQMKQQLPSGKTINDYVINSDGYVIDRGSEGRTTEKAIPLLNADGSQKVVKIADFNANFDMSIFSKISYKGVGLTMLWVWKQGGDIYNLTKQWMYLNLTNNDIDQAGKPVYKRKAIDYYTNFYDGLQLNSHFVENGTYLKLRELSVYYNITEKTFSHIKLDFIKNAKFSLLGRNLLTFTKYSGWDPEVGTPDPNGSGGSFYIIDMFNYPNFRTYSISLDLTF